MLKKYLIITIAVVSSFLLSACSVSLKHVPSPMLEGVTVKEPVSIMVADIGDARDREYPNRVGSGRVFLAAAQFLCV